MANRFVLESELPPDIVFPLPRDKYDIEMQRQLRDMFNKILTALKNTAEEA